MSHSRLAASKLTVLLFLLPFLPTAQEAVGFTHIWSILGVWRSSESVQQFVQRADSIDIGGNSAVSSLHLRQRRQYTSVYCCVFIAIPHQRSNRESSRHALFTDPAPEA